MDKRKLVHRIVNNTQTQRLSFYSRNDGLIFYAKEEISEWDDTPPAWIEVSASGLFPSIELAVQSAAGEESWLESGNHQQKSTARELRWRPLSVPERKLLQALLEAASNVDVSDSLDSLSVANIDKNRSIRVQSQESSQAERYPISRATYRDGVNRAGPIVEITLYAVEDHLNEMKIQKAGESPIEMDPYELSVADFEISRV